MSEDEYKQNFDALLDALRSFAVVGSFVSDADLMVMRETVGRADSYGHILDPTAYRKSLETASLRRQSGILSLVMHARRQLREIFPGDKAFWDAVEDSQSSDAGGTR